MHWAILMSSCLFLLVSVAIAPAPTRANEWTPLGPWGGPTTALAMSPTHPNRLFVAPPAGGVYRSDDSGDHWTWAGNDALIDFGITKIAVSPFDSDEVIAVAPPNHVFVSTDAGATWVKPTVGFSIIPSSVVFDPITPARIYLSGASSKPVLRSDDHGATWTEAFAGITGSFVGELAVHPSLPDVALTGSSAGIFRTTDAGASWISVASGNFSRAGFAWPQVDAERVYVNRNGSSNALYRSDDGGNTFTHVERHFCKIVDCPTTAIGCDATNADRLLIAFEVGSYEWYILETTDAGDSWHTIYEMWDARVMDGFTAHTVLIRPDDPQHVVFACSAKTATPNVEYVGWFPEGILRTTDGGGSWTPIVDGWASRRVLHVGSTSRGFIWARDDQGHGLYYSSGALPDDWVRSPVFSGYPRVGVEAFGVDWTSGVAFESVRLETDFLLWARFFYGPGFREPYGYMQETNVPPFTVFASNPGNGTTAYAWQEHSSLASTLWRVDDLGERHGTWAIVGEGPVVRAAAVHPTDPEIVFAIGDGAVYRTTDGGVTWTPMSNGLPDDDGVEILMRRSDPSVLGAVFRHAGVFQTTDAGQSWTDLGFDWGGHDATDACWGPDEETIVVATRGGVFIEGAGIVDDGLTTRRITSVEYSNAHDALLAGTERGAVWKLPWSFAVSALPETAEPGTLVARPNPFTGHTTFRFSRARDDVARLEIFDVQGRLVRRLETNRASGESVWDARDASGRRVAPGVYLVRAMGDETVATERVVYVR
jgi:photosystem II stability/assembly factor-like uncharacterized protein